MAETQRHAEFPATKWTIILKAAAGHSRASRVALEDLCRAYWPPLYAFLRRAGHEPDEAKDLVQGYIVRLLEREDLATVSPDKGRFRTYLLRGLRNHLVSEVRRETAQKRGGRNACFPLDTRNDEAVLAAGLAETLSPDVAFDRRWAETILDRSLEALRQEYNNRGKGRVYEALKSALANEAEDYSSLGRELSMTAGAVAVTVHRLRLRLRELVRAEVAQTVGSEADLEEEMSNLLAILSQ